MSLLGNNYKALIALINCLRNRNDLFDIDYIVDAYGYMPHEMASLTKWPITYFYLKLILFSKLGVLVQFFWLSI